MPKPAVTVRASRSLVGILPSIGDFAALIPVLFLFGRMNGAGTLLGDGDSGWHIRTGEWILANGRVPHKDVFSFTRPNQPWYAWEWLSDVAMGWLHHYGGMQAVLLAAITLLCLISALLYRLILEKSGSVPIAYSLALVAAGGSSIHWLARPHLFTMLFLIVFYSILELKPVGERPARLLLTLPFLTLVWTNLHGGFLIGIALTGCYAAGAALTALLAPHPDERRAAFRRSRLYSLVAIVCLATSLANPYGWQLHLHVIDFFAHPAYFQNIAEFGSISFRHPMALFFEAGLFLGLATGFWNLMQRRFTPFLLLLAFAHLALLSARNIPLYMIVAAPQIGLAWGEWADRRRLELAPAGLDRFFSALLSLSRRITAADAGPRWHLAPLAALATIGALMYAPSPRPHFLAEYNAAMYPGASMKVLRDNDRIFSSDTWGGYLIYRRFPAKVFIDGRSDFYGPDFEADYGRIMTGSYNWEALLSRYGADTVLLPAGASLSSTLKSSRNWQVISDDGVAIIFRLVR